MKNNLYITSTEARSGKSAISLGIMEYLLRNFEKVAFFRPIINTEKDQVDKDIHLIQHYFQMDIDYNQMYAYTFQEAEALISQGQQAQLLEGIFHHYKVLEQQFDFVLCEGTDFEGVTSYFEFDINADIANYLGCPVLIVANARHQRPEKMINNLKVTLESFEDKQCTILANIINRTPVEVIDSLRRQAEIHAESLKTPVYIVPEEPLLGRSSLNEIAKRLNAKVLFGEDKLDRHATQYTVAAMHVEHFLNYIQPGCLIITPGDRVDIILASLFSMISSALPNIAGVILTGGIEPNESVSKLINGMQDTPMAVLSVQEDTYHTALNLHQFHAGIDPQDERKIITALRLFDQYIPMQALCVQMHVERARRVTPKMFEYGLIQIAKSNKRHIVLPEANDKRILQAAEILLEREVVDITLLGNELEIAELSARYGIHLEKATIIDPQQSSYLDQFSKQYYELRKHKGISLEIAYDTMPDVTYFATMMVYNGLVDGLVSGAVHTTQQTIRPALEFIKTVPGVSIVSSVFFMCLKDKVLVYGDCAVNPKPTAQQLADIAVQSADTAATFGIDPKVALLSYSSGESGRGEEVERVREATRIARQQRPDLLIEGPIQYDAAIDPEVAKIKMPNSLVAGQATVFVFPDLNTGNNTYKAVQRTAGALAIGPVLQGLKMPVNDLSRGCKVPDIVNTIIITAIQAQNRLKQ